MGKTTYELCKYCSYSMPITSNSCPHCARPGLFPNVKLADQKDEFDALEDRYNNSVSDAVKRGCEVQLREFEQSLKLSKAVVNRDILEMLRLATNDNQLYATYYGLIEGGVRIPDDSKWHRLRTIVDNALLTDFHKEIRFASLALDEKGLLNYGNCSMVLKEDMIAHRSSVFEDNTVRFMIEHGIKIEDVNDLPRGYKASWKNRFMLCIAKLSGKISHATTSDDHAALLIVQGSDTGDDEFVEVHIYGPLSKCTIEKVVAKKQKKAEEKALLKGLKSKLGSIPMEVVNK